MLLARQRPLAAAFVKRLPVAAAVGARARGFGPRAKIVALPKKPLRIAAAPVEAPAEWAAGVDWLAAGEPVATLANGHDPGDLDADLPLPGAIAPVAAEARMLN